MKEAYFDRFGYFDRFIENDALNWDLSIVIPAYAEKMNEALFSALINCVEHHNVGVIWVVNYAAHAPQEYKVLSDEFRQHLRKRIHESNVENSMFILYLPDLLKKKSGVGIARKAGMDESIHHIKDDGIIACLDADCRISENYAENIINHFKRSNAWATSIDYAHDIDLEKDPVLRSAAIEYELHLRYFIQMQRRLQLPFAFHTIGSSMAVRGSTYIKMGGMNTRKAGEDFYFLQKHITYGYVDECHSTCIIPSCRTSFRVPFGTGKAIGDMISDEVQHFMTYHPECFDTVHILFNPDFWYNENQSDALELWEAFLENVSWHTKIEEIRKNTSGAEAFRKRFYSHADAFMLMKALHYLRDKWKKNIPVRQAVRHAFPSLSDSTTAEMLERFRHMQKNSQWDRKNNRWI